MGTFVRLCPEVVLGRHLAVTSIDSGVPWLTENQTVANWQSRSGIVYSPSLTSTDDVFYQRDGLDCPGFDEWYVFDHGDLDLGEVVKGNPFEPANAPRPGHLLVVVNYPSFVLHNPTERKLAEMFWKQLEWIEPESYISDGQDYLTFVTRNTALFDSVYERLNAALPS